MIEINKIYNKDCMELMQEIDTNSIDLILTSPPYNIGMDYDSYDDNMDWKEYYDWCEWWLVDCYRILKPDGRIALNHYISLGTSDFRTSPLSTLYSIMEKIGYKHHAISVWSDRTLAKATAWGSWLSASSPYINSPFEGIIIDYKDSWKKIEKGESDVFRDDFIDMTRGIWDFRTETNGKTKANFSIDFAEKIIKLLTYKNDLVFDPFIGSGTTAVACKLNDRNFIGSEISSEYSKIATNRVNGTYKQLTFDFGD